MHINIPLQCCIYVFAKKDTIENQLFFLAINHPKRISYEVNFR